MIDRATARGYEVTITLLNGNRMTAADLIVETDRRGRHLRSGLRYRNDWLTHPEAYALNPVHAPLVAEPIEWRTREIPAVVDEVMPGRWERTVLQRTWELTRERHEQGTEKPSLISPKPGIWWSRGESNP